MKPNKRSIELPEDDAEVVATRGSTSIRVVFNRTDSIAVYADVPVTLYPASNNSAEPEAGAVTKQAYKTGDILPDGWIAGPVSPDTGKPIALEPVEGALDGYQEWHAGEDHASKLRNQGHANARQPSDGELNAIYNDVVQAGRNGNVRLNTGDSVPYGDYWSSTTDDPRNSRFARVQYLGDGRGYWGYKGYSIARVRCVRDEPGLALA